MFEVILNELFDTSRWNMERKYVIRRRWFFGAIVGLLLAGIWLVVGNVWWTSNGYCWGDMMECLAPEMGMDK